VPLFVMAMLRDSEARSEELPRYAQSGVTTPIRRYFVWGENCTPDRIDIHITEQPKNGIVQLNDEAYVLREADVRDGSIGNCAGTKLPAKRLYYTATNGFEGRDRFAVTVRSSKFSLSDVYDIQVNGIKKMGGPPAIVARSHEPQLTAPPSSGMGENAVPMVSNGGTFKVPVTINRQLTLKFVVDSGAADVSIPVDVFMTLVRTGTITDADFLDKQTYRLADGSTLPSQRFVIRTLKIGDKTLENVVGSIAPVAGSLLLGQSFLSRFKSWSMDNQGRTLILD
jgi:gag-polyprotein putative aspartyl protease